MSFFIHSCVGVVALCVGPLLSFATAKPIAGEVVLVISGPFTDKNALIEHSGGRMIGPSSGVIGTLALSQDETFFDRLEGNGAWAVIDGTRLAQFCGVVL